MLPGLRLVAHAIPRRIPVRRRFGYSLVAVGISDPLPCPQQPPAPFLVLHSGDAVPETPFSVSGTESLCRAPGSQAALFGLHGAWGGGTLNYLADAWACASALEGREPWELDLHSSYTLGAEDCAALHQRALALRAPLLRLLAQPTLAVTRGPSGHCAYAARGMQWWCMSSPSELWDKLHGEHSASALEQLGSLTDALAAAAAGERGILVVCYDP